MKDAMDRDYEPKKRSTPSMADSIIFKTQINPELWRRIAGGMRDVQVRKIFPNEAIWQVEKTERNSSMARTEITLHITKVGNYPEIEIEMPFGDHQRDTLFVRDEVSTVNANIYDLFKQAFFDGEFYVSDKYVSEKATGENAKLSITVDWKELKHEINNPKKTKITQNELFLMYGTGELQDPSTDTLLPKYRRSGQVGKMINGFGEKLTEIIEPFTNRGTIPEPAFGVMEMLIEFFPEETIGTICYNTEVLLKTIADSQMHEKVRRIEEVERKRADNDMRDALEYEEMRRNGKVKSLHNQPSTPQEYTKLTLAERMERFVGKPNTASTRAEIDELIKLHEMGISEENIKNAPHFEIEKDGKGNVYRRRQNK